MHTTAVPFYPPESVWILKRNKDYLIILFPQSQGPPPPTELKLAIACHAEFVICDDTIEVDNFYVKQLLGLGDFRVQSYEAVEKWFALVFLAYTFLQWRLNHAENFKTIADVIRSHRQEHARHVLEAACKDVLHWQDITPVFERFICQLEPDTI